MENIEVKPETTVAPEASSVRFTGGQINAC